MKTRTETRPQPKSGARRWIDAAALVTLCALSLVLYRQIALTNLVLPGADAITYFYPYRAYAASAIREGRIPLWNPYLFLGVPFLANPQTGVLYPPNLLLTWLMPATAVSLAGTPWLVAWSLALHAALAACGAYLYARRVPRLSPLPALLGASAFAFGGYLSGQAEHVNQLNVSAWFPWLLLLWETRTKARWPALLGLGAVIGVGLLAGHTQSSYITLAGLGVYAALEAFLPQSYDASNAPPGMKSPAPPGRGLEHFRDSCDEPNAPPSMKAPAPPGRGLEHFRDSCDEPNAPPSMKAPAPPGRGLEHFRNRHGEHGEEEKRSDTQPISGVPNPLRALLGEYKSSAPSFLLRVLRVSVVPLLDSLLALSSQAMKSVGSFLRVLRVSVVSLFDSLWQLGFALLIGLGLAAVQLLPTLELSRLSIRSGGLTYREAVAFSLKPLPRLLRYTFLPAWGQNLRGVFGGDFFTEYVAYVGVVPLLLALWACILIVASASQKGRISLYEVKVGQQPA